MSENSVNPINPINPAQVAVKSVQAPVVASAATEPLVQPTSSLNMQDLDLEFEIKALKEKVDKSSVPPALKQKLEGMIMRLIKMSQKGNFSQEFEPVSEYINWVVQIPFGKFSEDNIEINHAKEMLVKNHYGLDEVKNRIL